MRCHICNTILKEGEIKEDPRFGDFSPCGKCQQIIDEVFEPLDEEEIRKRVEKEAETDTYEEI